ncbi:hypothetical protein ACF0H5_022975 [Mactra antiquata]
MVNCAYSLLSSNIRERFRRFRTLDNYWGTSGFLQNIKNIRSAPGCGNECIDNPECLSFFYDTANKICQIHEYKYETRTLFLPRPNTQYFSMINVSVPTNYTCVVSPPDTSYTTAIMTDGTLFKYRIGWEQRTQSSAQSVCQSEGGTLIRILSLTKLKTMAGILTSCNGYSFEFWVDGSNLNAVDPYNISQWKTIYGEPLPSEPSLSDFWYVNEPVDPVHENCISMYGGPNFDNTFVSWSCDGLFYYICEK